MAKKFIHYVHEVETIEEEKEHGKYTYDRPGKFLIELVSKKKFKEWALRYYQNEERAWEKMLCFRLLGDTEYWKAIPMPKIRGKNKGEMTLVFTRMSDINKLRDIFV